jgi:HK97 family phage major capsid protein
MELETMLTHLQTELKGFIDKANAEQKTFGSALEDTKNAIKELQKQVDAIDLKLQHKITQSDQRDLGTELKENESLNRLIRDGRGTAVISLKGGIADLEKKTTITSSAVGDATSGVLMFARTPGIVPEARRQLRIRDLLTSIPTTANAIDYVKVNSFSKVVSPQTEASAKGESEMTFTTASANVRCIATWIPATRQILDDFVGLEAFLRSSLVYALDEEIEDQILSGNNSGQNLNGLTNQATSYNTALTVNGDGWKKVDLIGRAIQQIAVANEAAPNFCVLNPADAWNIRLQKTSTGEYIYGNPTMGGPSSFFGLTPVVTTAMSSGYFLVGSSAPNVAVVRDRMATQVEISTEHSDYFTKNMIAIRVEARLALVVFRPAAYIYGAFTQSPA